MRKFKRFLSLTLTLAFTLALIMVPMQAGAKDLSISVDWKSELQTHEGVGSATAFNKTQPLMQVAEFEPETTKYLIELMYGQENGIGLDLVRTILGDGGVSHVATSGNAPGYNPLTGLRAAGTANPGFDVEGNPIPMNGTTGQYGYYMGWGNRNYDGPSDTIWPNEPTEAAKTVLGLEDGELGFVWELDQWEKPVTGDKGGFTNDFIGKGEVKIVDRPRTMKEIFDVDNVWVMLQAKAYGVETFYANAWTPPYWMKDSMVTIGTTGDYLRNSEVDGKKPYFQYYADYMSAYVYGYWTEFGIPITHVGPYNESEASHTSYSGFRYRNAAEVEELFNQYILPTFEADFKEGGKYYGALSPDGEKLDWTPIAVLGEGTAMNNSFNPSSAPGAYLAKEENFGKVTASSHFYGDAGADGNARTISGSPGTTPLTAGSITKYPATMVNYSIWQSEYMGRHNSSGAGNYTQRHYYQSIDDAIRWTYMISNTFNSTPGFNAYIWWWASGCNGANGSDLIRWQTSGSGQNSGSTLNGTYHVFKRFYTFGHLSRFINPGDVHIESTTVLGDYLNSVAYKNSDGTDFSVTLTNAEYAPHTVTIDLKNFEDYSADLSALTVFQTTDSENIKKAGTVQVTPNNAIDGYSVTITIPAQSVVTLVPADGNYATFNGLDGERDLYSTLEATGNDGVLGNPTEATGKNGYPAMTMKNGDALIYKNVNFADGSASGGIVRRHLLYILANIESAPAGGIIRAYVTEPGTTITNPAEQAVLVGEFLIPAGTDSARNANTTSYQGTGTRSTRIDTGDLGAYKNKDLYLVAFGPSNAELFTVSRFRFDPDDGNNTAGNVSSPARPAAVGVLENGDFESNSNAVNTNGWTAQGVTFAVNGTQNYSGLNSALSSSNANAYSAQLSDRTSGTGIYQTVNLVAGENYTFRGMFMPTVDDATAKAELIYIDADGTEIGRNTVAERGGLDLMPIRGGGSVATDENNRKIVTPGLPMNALSINPTQWRPSTWYEVLGTFTYNPPEGTVSTRLLLSDNTSATLHIDEVTLVAAPDRLALIEALDSITSDIDVSKTVVYNDTMKALTSADLSQSLVNQLVSNLQKPIVGSVITPDVDLNNDGGTFSFGGTLSFANGSVETVITTSNGTEIGVATLSEDGSSLVITLGEEYVPNTIISISGVVFDSMPDYVFNYAIGT